MTQRYSEELLTVKEVAEILKVKPTSVYAMVRRGTLPAYEPADGMVRIMRGDLYRPRVKGPRRRGRPDKAQWLESA